MLKQLGYINTNYPPPPLTLRILGFLKTYITILISIPIRTEKMHFVNMLYVTDFVNLRQSRARKNTSNLSHRCS